MMTTLVGAAFGMLTLLAVPGVHAQSMRVAVPADSVPLTVVAAELQGAQHPRPLPSDVAQSHPEGSLQPTGIRKCVQVAANSATSGEFVAGGFASYAQRWRAGAAKLWWAPASVPQGAAVGTAFPLQVVAVRLGRDARAYIFRLEHLAATIPRRGLFYPSGITLGSAGTWMLVVTAGGNWGCFLYHLA